MLGLAIGKRTDWELYVMSVAWALNSEGPRFGKSYTSHARATTVHAFICCDVALVTFLTPGPNLLNTFIIIKNVRNTNHIGISYVGLIPTETMSVTTENPGPLRRGRRSTRAESEPGRTRDPDQGIELASQNKLHLPFRHALRLSYRELPE